MLKGKDLKIKRIMLDMKAIEVASHLKVHKSYISKLENQCQAIPVHIYDRWVEFLNSNENK